MLIQIQRAAFKVSQELFQSKSCGVLSLFCSNFREENYVVFTSKKKCIWFRSDFTALMAKGRVCMWDLLSFQIKG